MGIIQYSRMVNNDIYLYQVPETRTVVFVPRAGTVRVPVHRKETPKIARVFLGIEENAGV